MVPFRTSKKKKFKLSINSDYCEDHQDEVMVLIYR